MSCGINDLVINMQKKVEEKLIEFLLKNKAPCKPECLIKAGYELKSEKFEEKDIFAYGYIFSLYKHNKFIDRVVFKYKMAFKID